MTAVADRRSRVRRGQSPVPRGRVGVGLVAAALGLGVAAYLAKPHPELQPWPVLGLWLASVASFLAGAYLLERRALPLARLRLERDELLVIGALTGAALLARVVALGTLPDNVGGDEAESAIGARSVLYGDVRDPFSTGWAGHPTLWFFLQALSLKLFGDDVFGARTISAALGTATIPALYLFARVPYGRPVATVAAALLATLPVHVHYSRIAVNSVGDPLLMLVAVGLLVAGLRLRSTFVLAAAGVAAGLAQHFYLGSRLVPLVALAVLVHQVVVARSRLVASGRGLVLAAAGFLVAYGPAIRVPLYHRNDYNARLSQVGIFQSGWFDAQRELGRSVWDIFADQLTQSAGAFTHVPDVSANYLAGVPVFDPVTAVFFTLGIAFVLVEWRRAATAATLAWLGGAVLAGGVLMVSPPQSHRYLTAVAPACLLAAVGIVRTAPAVSAALPPRTRVAMPALTAALVLGVGVWNLDFYFRDYSGRYIYGSRQGEEITEIGRYLAAQPPGTHVYFFGAPWTFFGVGTIRFLAPDVTGTDVHRRIRRIGDLPEDPRARGRRRVFVFLPPRVSELAAVRAARPGGRVIRFVGKADREPLFTAYEPVGEPSPGR